MPRQNLIRANNLPYHVTTRTHNQLFFPIPLTDVWEFFKEALFEANIKHPIHLVSAVLMHNHYHMIIVTPEENLDKFMYELNKRLALKIIKVTNLKGRVFGSRYRWGLIRSRDYYQNCYRYIYQNPMRAKLVNKAEDYPFSTLNYIVSGRKFPVSIHDKFGFKDLYNLEWLNQKIEAEEVEKVKKGLRKYEVLPKKN